MAIATVLSWVPLWQSGRLTQNIYEYSSQGDNEEPLLAPVLTKANRTTSRMQFSRPCNISCTLPQWMQNYMSWHTNQLQQIRKHPPSEQPWLQQRLLVVRCLEGDRCGGTADRLKSLPLSLAVAAKTRRLLFLRWTRPFRLEEFMVPGEQFNWTVPDSLVPLLDSNKTSKVFFGGKAANQNIVKSAHNPSIWVVEGAAQQAREDLFRNMVSGLQGTSGQAIANPPDFFHDKFLALFRPVPALHALVEHEMQELDLWPNQFVTAHIRAKYPGEPYRETWNVTLLQRTVENAIDCASSLVSGKGLPVYVASDTLVSLQAAQAYGKSSTPYRVVSHLDVPTSDESSSNFQVQKKLPHQDPPHLNFAKEEDPSAFFSIFADLFIMSQSRCVAVGAGGFGRFGSLVSFNATCHIAHSTKGKLNSCTSVGGKPGA